MNINIEIKGQQAHIVNQQSLISGTSNLEEIKFDFSSEWDGYTKTAVIYVDDYSISDSVKMLVEKDVVSAEKLPDWLFREECELYIGVFGDNSEGRRITSTIVCQKVKKGVPVDVVNEITPDIYNQIIKIMCDAKALVKEADEKIEVNKGYLEQAEQKANDAADYADRAGNYLEEVVGQKTDVEKLIADIDVKVNESTTNIANITEAKMNDISSLTEAKSNDIATLTTAKMEDIANTTNAKLEDINNTAQAQIESINTVAQQNIKSGTDAVNKAAQGKIYSINETAQGQINAINNTATNQIGEINGAARGQISAINNTALSQIDSINNTAISQIENMTVKYSDMCRTLGIEHEGYLKIKNTKEGSMDVSKFKYIKFGMIYKAGNVGSQGITIPTSSWHFYIKENAEANKSTMVTSDKEYDISSLSKLNYSLRILYEYDEDLFIEYKLYNKSEETTEE
ncbi:hypothetical protein [Eubacterium ventriosum]|uniref:hypothetical protein n=1 Tax=Eubacterium ventriosum TaxID=39496 RepID=UPI003521ABB0